jgi:hypothetical protein
MCTLVDQYHRTKDQAPFKCVIAVAGPEAIVQDAVAIFGEAGLVLIAASPGAWPGSLSVPATPFGLASRICLPERNLQRLKMRWMFANYLSPAARDLGET